MKPIESVRPLTKLPVGIPGFDFISDGGLPEGRATLVTGTTGSGKTIFACQFLAEGIRRGEPGVFVTFEESPSEIRSNMASFAWEIDKWESESKWSFIDVSPQFDQESTIIGAYELRPLLARIENSVRKTKAKRLSIDSLGAIFVQLEDNAAIRRELLKMFNGLKGLGVTCVVTAERTEEYGRISQFGVEEFVADNVIIFRNALVDEIRRRSVEILKFRGSTHHKGEFPFTVIPGDGIVVIPLSSVNLEQPSSAMRVSCGNDELDKMCNGGYFRDSVTLVSGATGTGKTLMVTEFLAGGVKGGERCLLFAFEESRDQLLRNAAGWGYDFAKMEKDGKLLVVAAYPEARGLEDHLIAMKKVIRDFQPNRMAVDSLSALERVSSLRTFREFVIGLTSYVKELQVTGLFTSATPTLMGGTSITETHISTITDAIILLRYVEVHGEMKRGLTVLKMRGSFHDKQIREYAIDSQGMHIGRAFRNVNGIISGTQIASLHQEMDRLSGLFSGDGGNAGG